MTGLRLSDGRGLDGRAGLVVSMKRTYDHRSRHWSRGVTGRILYNCNLKKHCSYLLFFLCSIHLSVVREKILFVY